MSEFPKSLNSKQAVLATLAYFDIFGVALTRAEISEYLFLVEPDDEKIDIYLRESPLIRISEGYYSIQWTDQQYSSFFEKSKRSREYWKKIRRFHWLFSLCPFVRWIAVCNSLTIQNVHENSDIDLFIVVDRGRLFTARFFLTFLTQVFGIRRHDEKIKKRFCLSFYITEDHLDLKPIVLQPYDIYLAYWIKTLQPIAGNFEDYEDFLKKNENWTNHYFDKELHAKKRYYRKREGWAGKIKKHLEKLFQNSTWEENFKLKQWNRIQEKWGRLENRAGTIISDNILKFHDMDSRESIRKDWIQRLETLL